MTAHNQSGTRLRVARLTAGLTQDELAEAAGVGRETIGRSERNPHEAKVGTALAIVDALNRQLPPDAPALTVEGLFR